MLCLNLAYFLRHPIKFIPIDKAAELHINGLSAFEHSNIPGSITRTLGINLSGQIGKGYHTNDPPQCNNAVLLVSCIATYLPASLEHQ